MTGTGWRQSSGDGCAGGGGGVMTGTGRRQSSGDGCAGGGGGGVTRRKMGLIRWSYDTLVVVPRYGSLRLFSQYEVGKVFLCPC